MDDNYSQRFNVSLGELEEEYARLLAETASRDNLSQQSGKKGSDNLRWTRVVSREHFQIWAEPLNMPGVLEPSTACRSEAYPYGICCPWVC